MIHLVFSIFLQKSIGFRSGDQGGQADLTLNRWFKKTLQERLACHHEEILNIIP